MLFPCGETITRQRATRSSDGYGGTFLDWSLPTDDLDIGACGLAPRVGEELGGPGRAGVVVGFTLYAPFGADITFEDRIVCDAGTFEIEGEPGSWANPFTGTQFGVTAALRRVEG